MEAPNVYAPRDEDDVELQSVTPVALDDGDQLPFESFDDLFWPLPGYEHDDPLINGLQTYLSQPTYAPPGEYTVGDLTGFPVNSHVHQNFMCNEEHRGLLSFGNEWSQHQSIGLNFSSHDAEGNQHVHSSLSLANDGQDAMTVWGDIHVSSADTPHYPTIVGGDVMDNGPAPPLTSSGGLRCQHYVQGRPCGAVIEGGVPGILAHFACVHVRTRLSANARSNRPSKSWTCGWGGKCVSHIRKEGFKRHVLSHFFRWKCSTCLSPYSRDDSARKHAKDCGHGRIFMEPRSEVCPRQL
ncbi:hypothetical protein BDR03DRAFT_1013588 [Suillus americanus]|nr:hypothetical protein BDR03DRAFT_1013588 [Suillus americanus]